MVTIYELLEVAEDATKEEIEKSYSKLILEFHQDPKLDEQTNQENQMILNKMKIAYEILIDDQKRKQYDQNLAKKRAENLIQSVEVQQELTQEEKNEECYHDNENLLTDEEKKSLKEAAKKEFQQNLKKAKQAEKAYNDAYYEAYHKYLEKMRYEEKKPWAVKRIIRILLTVLTIVIMGVIVWMIPPARNILIKLYEENFIIHALVDLVNMMFQAIFSIF